MVMMIQYVQLDNSCTRTACSCTGVQIVSSHILTDVTVAVTKKLRGRVPLGPHGCCAYATVVVLHCVTGVTGQSGSTPLPPKNFLLGSRRIPWPGRNAGLGLGGTCPRAPRGYIRHWNLLLGLKNGKCFSILANAKSYILVNHKRNIHIIWTISSLQKSLERKIWVSWLVMILKSLKVSISLYQSNENS